VIGRVAAAKGGVPAVVLKQGKEWLFANGSPMVRGWAVNGGWGGGGGRPGRTRMAECQETPNSSGAR
jgi:hypothetical protein